MPAHSFNQLIALLPEQRAWREFARLFRSASRTGCAHAQRVSCAGRSKRFQSHQRPTAVALDRTGCRLVPCGGTHRRDGFAGVVRRLQKKETQSYTAHHAALGGRTLKTGQSRCFVGYKKHTFRLWWREYTPAVMLVPLVSWAAPANVSEAGFPCPACMSPPAPGVVVAADYRRGHGLSGCRSRSYLSEKLARGSRDQIEDQHESGAALCCLEPSRVPSGSTVALAGICSTGRSPLVWRQWRAALLPTLLGSIGLQTAIRVCSSDHETSVRVAAPGQPAELNCCSSRRPWIEPTQSYDRNQLGLSQVFFNSLRLTWCMSLLADAAGPLRNHALLHAPVQQQQHLLRDLAPQQGFLESGCGNAAGAGKLLKN